MNNNIPVICYHSIAPLKNNKWNRNFLTLEIKFFKEHLDYLKKHGYISLFLDEYFDLRGKHLNGKKYFVFTFDDGYVDNFIYVYPLLKKYNFKGTIFVNPDFVDAKSEKRKNFFDYWDSKVTLNDIEYWGFLSWEEMQEMEKKGVMDIQSHTLTHTKYCVSDKLIGFHHPGADSIYPIGNLYPERKPYYIFDSEFEKLIPYGFPLFEEKSSVIARKATINQEFTNLIVQTLANYDWSVTYNFDILFDQVKDIYDNQRNENKIIDKFETDEEYQKRLCNELKLSKDIIEKNLDKKVDYLCWPHGDNDEHAHKLAITIGYRATSQGKMILEELDKTRFNRIHLESAKYKPLLNRLKARYKLESTRKKQPYYAVKNVYEFLRDL